MYDYKILLLHEGRKIISYRGRGMFQKWKFLNDNWNFKEDKTNNPFYGSLLYGTKNVFSDEGVRIFLEQQQAGWFLHKAQGMGDLVQEGGLTGKNTCLNC